MTDRNDPCPCGSGKKYKKCCLGKAMPPGTDRAGVTSKTTARGMSKADAEALLRQAIDHHNAGAYGRARALYEQVRTARPRDQRALIGIARIDAQHGRLAEAIALAQQAIDIEPRQPPAWEAMANLLLADNRPEAAIEAAQRAIALRPGYAAAYRVLANAYERTHRLDEALEAAQAAVDAAPDYAAGRLALAQLLRRSKQSAAAISVIEPCISQVVNPSVRASMLTELARNREQVDDYDGAFAAMEESGRVLGETTMARRLDPDQRIRELDAFAAAVSDDDLVRAAAMDFSGDSPGESSAHPQLAFLVGHPRSGTTMTEQVLAAHSHVRTSDEEPIMDVLVEAVPGAASVNVVTRATALDREAIVQVRAAYWAQVAADIADDIPAEHVFIDKLPLNLMHIGLINLIFPDAKVIVALRDPRDVILSSFMQQFVLNASMVNYINWERAATFYAAVMGYWLTMRDRITLDWMEVRYEDTVTDLRGQAERLLSHLDLEWEDEVLAFYEKAKQRSINTPSYAAVTEKVHTRAVARWKNYERHYAPVMDTLQPYIDAFGYG